MTRRRTFKPDFKARVVLEDLTGVKSAAEICREHQLKPQVLARWKVEFVQRAPEIFATSPRRRLELSAIRTVYRVGGGLKCF